MPDDPPRYRSLLRPEDCLIVLILGRGFKRAAMTSLLEAAEFQGVPAIALIDGETVEAPPSCTAMPCRRLNPFDDRPLRRRLAALRRPRLLVGGGRAETSLAFTALCALEEGYDVHLLRDLCTGASESLTEIAVARMVQAGAVPVSTVQVLAEWRCALPTAVTAASGRPPGSGGAARAVRQTPSSHHGVGL